MPDFSPIIRDAYLEVLERPAAPHPSPEPALLSGRRLGPARPDREPLEHRPHEPRDRLRRQVGQEYVCYFPMGGSKSLELAAGDYRQEYWDPRAGGFTGPQLVSHPGGPRALETPDARDWVLHLVR